MRLERRSAMLFADESFFLSSNAEVNDADGSLFSLGTKTFLPCPNRQSRQKHLRLVHRLLVRPAFESINNP